MSRLKRGVFVCAVFFSGWILSQFTGEPKRAWAQARISLASLQQQVDAIINGTTTVGSINWAGIRNVPPGLSDGDDVGITTAGAGLVLTPDGSTLEVDLPNLDVRYLKLPNGSPSAGQTLRFNGAEWVYSN